VSSVTSLISVLVLLCGLVAAAFFLRRYRDGLNRHFAKGPIQMRGMLHLGDGARVYLIEVEGVSMVCGVGRNGIGAIQTVGTKKAEEFSL
jgi:hypothetical protein